ncbi:unnamed protein product [Owenia fusiformis]|uniref:Uncharacterized protein n=1 Tax=Owenia fusiformis TaxID=6347 RepID=A0A8S4NQ71_OWEFU|nr:unnamed protein product [Owenia fusiformis]
MWKTVASDDQLTINKDNLHTILKHARCIEVFAISYPILHIPPAHIDFALTVQLLEAKKLQYLSLTGWPVSTLAFIESVKNTLETVELNFCPNLVDEDIEILSECTDLRLLQICYSVQQFHFETLLDIVNNLHKLEALYLDESIELTFSQVVQLLEMRPVSRLSVSLNVTVSDLETRALKTHYVDCDLRLIRKKIIREIV